MEQTQFDVLADNMLFRIGSYQTDSVTQDFLTRYVPLIARKPEPGTWTAHPPPENPPPEVLTRHSLVFIKHPFVDIQIKEGRLDILTREQNGKVVGFLTYYVTLSFDSKQNGEQAFDNLCQLFTPISTSKHILTRDTKRVAVFKNSETTRWRDEVQFVLTQDEVFDHKYKIVFGTILHPDFTDHYSTTLACMQ